MQISAYDARVGNTIVMKGYLQIRMEGWIGMSDVVTPQPDPQDVEKNKVIALLSYIIFFLPYLAAKDSPFAMYHANQGLILLLTSIAINIVGYIIPVIGWFILIPFGNLAILVLLVLGILNALNGQMKPLPLIGKYQIIK